MRALLNLAAVLALAAAGIVYADGQPLTYHLMLPMVSGSPSAYPLPVTMQKGAAACNTNTIAVAPFCYRYWPGWLAVEGQGIEIVPLVSVRLVRMAGYTAPFTPTHVGQAWMLFNEPDWSDPSASDSLTPREGANLFRQYSDQLIGQGARIVCCNTLFGHAWNDAMFAEYQALYGEDARARISAYSFHDYVSVAGGLDAWRAQAQEFIRWANGKPVWMTEVGWKPYDDGSDWPVQVTRMQTLCAELHKLALARVAWFAGFTWAGVERIALLDQAGQPSPVGVTWKDC